MRNSVFGSPKQRFYLALAVVALASLLAQPVVAGAQTPASLSPVLLRATRNFHYAHPWAAVCGSDFCGIPTIARIGFATPASAQQVNVDVSVTLNFKVSAGDKIQVHAGYSRNGGRTTSFPVGSYPLTSSSSRFRSSTTLTWTAKKLPAAGAHYVIEVSVYARHGRGGPNVRASGTKAALTVTEES
jgi:hypothetical protein